MLQRLLLAYIPKSLRAGVALVVMLITTTMLASGMQSLFTTTSTKSTLMLVVGVVVGLPATVCFYYFQSKDGRVKSPEALMVETLAEAGKKSSATITPAYPPDTVQPASTPGSTSTPQIQDQKSSSSFFVEQPKS